MRLPIITGTIIALVSALVLTCQAPAQTQAQQDQSQAKKTTILDQPGRLFDLKIPEAYKSEEVEEAGIARWRKDNNEILIAVGEIFVETPESLFSALQESAKKGERFESVSTLKLKKGRAILFKEKGPEDQSRLQSWRLVVITDKKIINLDFSAPAKDFKAAVPDFESVIRSFKLRLSS